MNAITTTKAMPSEAITIAMIKKTRAAEMKRVRTLSTVSESFQFLARHFRKFKV
jgi:hypothetical protein